MRNCLPKNAVLRLQTSEFGVKCQKLNKHEINQYCGQQQQTHQLATLSEQRVASRLLVSSQQLAGDTFVSLNGNLSI